MSFYSLSCRKAELTFGSHDKGKMAKTRYHPRTGQYLLGAYDHTHWDPAPSHQLGHSLPSGAVALQRGKKDTSSSSSVLRCHPKWAAVSNRQLQKERKLVRGPRSAGQTFRCTFGLPPAPCVHLSKYIVTPSSGQTQPLTPSIFGLASGAIIFKCVQIETLQLMRRWVERMLRQCFMIMGLPIILAEALPRVTATLKAHRPTGF